MFCLGWWNVANGFKKPSVIEPIHPLKRCELNGLEVSPGSSLVNDLGFVEPVDGFSQGVVVGVADTSHRGFDPGFRQTFGVFD